MLKRFKTKKLGLKKELNNIINDSKKEDRIKIN